MNPIFRKGMVLRVSFANFTWLMKSEPEGSILGMVQVPKGSHLTVLENMYMESGSAFGRYPVLFEQQLLCLLEPSINFHANNGFLKVVEESR